MLSLLFFVALAQAACDWKSSNYGSFSGDLLPEASGMTSDGKNLYFINDTEGDGAVYVYSSEGELVRKSISWAPRNLEAISRGKCGSKTCLFLADIGDNDRDRESVSVLAVEEGTFQKTQEWKFRYEDGAQNVEAFFVSNEGEFFFLSKSEKKKSKGEAKLYRMKIQESGGMAEKIGSTNFEAPVTDMAVSPDGKKIAVLTTTGASEFSYDSFVQGDFAKAKVLPVQNLAKQESIAYLTNEALLWSSEAKKMNSVPILRLDCRPSLTKEKK